MDICVALFSMWIVGAYEFKPGLMYVEQLDPETHETKELIVYTDDYLRCWKNSPTETNSAGN